MNICENSNILYIIMYFKYIIIFIVFINLIIEIFTKEKSNLRKKIIKILSIFLLIYILISIILISINNSLKFCVMNSNPFKIQKYIILNKTKESIKVQNVNSFLKKLDPIDTISIGTSKLDVYNQNVYPVSDYKFNLIDSSEEYSLKNSGNEVLTLSTALSSLNIGYNTNPVELLNVFRKNNITNLSDMNLLLTILSNEYGFYFKQITEYELYNGLKNDGIVIAKVQGNTEGTIFTCTDSYIIIYGVTNTGEYKINSSNNKENITVCKNNTKGFGNIVEKNVNDVFYNIYDIKDNINNYYILWR